MTRKNILTSWVMLLMPAFIVFLLSGLIEPLKIAFSEYPDAKYISYGIALGLGFLMFRRARLVRDHEWFRQSALKSVDKHIKAEERGVWEKDVAVPSGLASEGKAFLAGKTGQLTSERQTAELGQDDKRDVVLLQESSHVAKATRRIDGVETFAGDEVESTIGATRRAGPMDRFLDWISRKISGTDRAGERLQERQTRLAEVAATAPMKDPQVKQYSQSSNDSNEHLEPANAAPSPYEYDPSAIVDSQPSSTPSPPQPTVAQTPKPTPMDPEMERLYGSSSQSIEAMAGIASPGSNSPSSSGSSFSDPNSTKQSGYTINRCPECGHGNEVNARFCAICGGNL